MDSISIHVDDRKLLVELGNIGREVHRAMHDVIEETAIDTRDQWKANAKVTAGTHGKLYPGAIRYRMVPGFALMAIVEPNQAARQGAMAFEDGSVNQPPHMDGQRAKDMYEPIFHRRVDTVVSFL